ncbi:MAG: hypothetical protein N2C14_24475 [Planctomycetales bacterium]
MLGSENEAAFENEVAGVSLGLALAGVFVAPALYAALQIGGENNGWSQLE